MGSKSILRILAILRGVYGVMGPKKGTGPRERGAKFTYLEKLLSQTFSLITNLTHQCFSNGKCAMKMFKK